jgi:hypothetical protein
MVVVEKAIDRRIKAGKNEPLGFVRIIPGFKKIRFGRSILGDTDLYNLEPYSSPGTKIDLGIELYDIESSWK